MAKKVKKAGKSCGCKPADCGWLLLCVLICALALFAIVKGVYNQWMLGDWLWAIVYYAVGFFLMKVACVMKYKVAEACPTHK